MYNTLGITFSVCIWTTVILFLSLIFSKSWIIFIIILINIAVFVFFGISSVKEYEFMRNFGSKIISGICLSRSWGFDFI